jgi:hypothetical protein
MLKSARPAETLKEEVNVRETGHNRAPNGRDASGVGAPAPGRATSAIRAARRWVAGVGALGTLIMPNTCRCYEPHLVSLQASAVSLPVLKTVDLTRESSSAATSRRFLYRRCERLVTSTRPHGCDRGCDQDGSQLARRGETGRDRARAHTEASRARELQRRRAKTTRGLLITQRSQVQILPPLPGKTASGSWIPGPFSATCDQAPGHTHVRSLGASPEVARDPSLLPLC